VQQQQPKVDINALLGPLPTTSPAASSGKAPLPLDDFCSMPTPAAAAPAPAADPFGPFVATTPAAASSGLTAAVGASAGGFSSDPFAASGAVHMLPQAQKQHAAPGPKLGPETAKAKDPFADLLM
jgi:hypothetical protein